MNNIYILGGSPCCGKSTIAEKICEKYGIQYYKVDNYLDK
jgi:adenylate kinase family enzyme